MQSVQKLKNYQTYFERANSSDGERLEEYACIKKPRFNFLVEKLY